jgi:excisionase family DNA binding protein
MAVPSSPKRRKLDVIGRPEGGSGGTRPAVVPPDRPVQIRRDIAATLHELVDTLIELATVDRTYQATPANDLPLLLDAIGAGKLLSISRAKVLELAARGQIPSLRVGRSVRIPRDRLVAWLAEATQDTLANSSSRIPAWARVDRSNEL